MSFKRPWLLVLALVPAVLCAQPIYTWVGPRGTVHYADHPHPGARRIDIGDGQGFALQALPAPPASSAPAPKHASPTRNPTLRILSPANGASLFNIGGVTTATVEVHGSLPGEELVYELDGRKVAGPTAATSVSLERVWRGTHKLTVLLVSPAGRVVARAASVFYVHQHSVLLHPRPLARAAGARAFLRT